MIEATLRLSGVESALAPADDGKVRLSIRLDSYEMAEAEDAAYRRIVRQVRLPGFRPGRAPRKVLEARLGVGYIRAEAMQDALGDYYRQAVVRHDVDVIAPPEIDITAGRDDGPVTFEALVEVRPEVTADGYDALTVELPDPRPTEEEINARLDALRAQFSELETTSRPAIDTDHVTIDVFATHNGVEVEGLTVSDYTYELGSGAVVPEIDENLRGAKAGDILEFNARHPDETVEDLLRFRILVKEVQARILPDLDDDLVRSASEFETVDEFRADVTDRLTDLKRAQVRMLLRESVSKAVADLVVAEVPGALIEAETDRRLEDFEKVLKHQDGTLEGYLAASGQSLEELRAQMDEAAEQSVRLDLALRAVAVAEALDVDDADLRAEAERTAERMELDPATLRDRLDRSGGWSALRAERRKMLALRWLMDNATVTNADGVPIAAEHLAEPEPPSDGTEAGEAGEDHAAATAGHTTDGEADPAPAAGARDAGIDSASDSEVGAGLDAPEVNPAGDADAPQAGTEAVSSDPGTTRRRRRWIPRP
ncbi:MAG: trigger factor [bacterium]|nr:trigger factor [bacterium]